MTAPSAEKLYWFKNQFMPHFDEWVFGPINRLVISQDALIGFIFMSCAIDYLAGFRWGKTTKGVNRKSYIEFIDTYFEKNKYDSDGLYDSLRNGLVHMFTIKNKKYALIHNKPEVHLKKDQTGQIIINAGNFRDELAAAKDKYFNDVETSSELMDKIIDRINREGFLSVSTVVI
jgi:hypothetical protein